ncbi:MAG TPA: RDD family protein, partial [Myxococcaceae bacterium]|nr:RDD family protein [Myxococcaceae bacterium]
DGLMVTLHAWQPVLGPALILTALIAAAYSVAFSVMWDGKTPGRRLMGLKLVDLSGTAPTPARAVTRAVLSWVSVGAFLSGYWLLLFDRRRQSLHDKLTQTFIVLPARGA